jgi:hypothetical protein
MVPTILAHLAWERLFASPPDECSSMGTGLSQVQSSQSKPGYLSDASVVPSPALNVANSSEDTQVYPPHRVMVSTDVASAGVNFHHANTLFDLPWSGCHYTQVTDKSLNLLHWSRPPSASGTIDMTTIGRVPVT